MTREHRPAEAKRSKNGTKKTSVFHFENRHIINALLFQKIWKKALMLVFFGPFSRFFHFFENWKTPKKSKKSHFLHFFLMLWGIFFQKTLLRILITSLINLYFSKNVKKRKKKVWKLFWRIKKWTIIFVHFSFKKKSLKKQKYFLFFFNPQNSRF